MFFPGFGLTMRVFCSGLGLDNKDWFRADNQDRCLCFRVYGLGNGKRNGHDCLGFYS